MFRQYVGGELPDQLAFGANGDLYVSLAFSNQISKLAADGSEITRWQSAPGEETPLDSPARIAFYSRDKTLLIANHALLSGNPANFAVLELYTDDPGDPLEKPSLP